MDAGPPCGLIPMSRLPQEHISVSGTGKRFDSTLNHSVSAESKKKAPKRKTLSSRYGAGIHPKRRKLGLNAIKDPNLSPNESLNETKSVEGTSNHQALVADRPVVRKRGRPRKSASSPGDLGPNSKSFTKANFARDAGLHATYLEENSKHALNTEALTPKGHFKVAHKTETLCNSTGFLSESKTKLDANVGSEAVNQKVHALSTNGKVKTKSKSLRTYNADSTLSLDQIGKSRTAAGVVRKIELNNLKRESDNKHFSNLLPPQQSNIEIRTAADNEAVNSNNSELASFATSEVQGSLASCGTTEDGLFSDTRNLRPRRTPKRELETRLLPTDYVGKRVVVYWPHAKAWFAGTVVKYDDSSKKHHIKYDDDDEEFISFRRHKVMLEVPPALPSPATPGGETAGENKKGDWLSKMVDLEGSVCYPEVSSEHDRSKENFSTALSRPDICNGSVHHVLRDRTADHSPNKQMVLDVSHKKISDRMQLQVVQGSSPLEDVSRADDVRTAESSDRTDCNVDPFSPNERDGPKASLVYVRRQKKKQKDQDTSTEDRQKHLNKNVVEDDKSNEYKIASLNTFSDADQTEMIGTTQSACVNSDVNMSDAGAQEHPRKRNKLKKLVCIDKYEEPMQDPFLSGNTSYARDEKVRKRARKRRGRKRKLCSSSPKIPNGSVSPLMSSINGNHHVLIPTVDKEHLKVSVCCQSRSTAVNQNSEVHGHFLVHRIHAAFHSTIYLMLPLITPELFTWQLFNILVHVGFCESDSFDGKFSINGSIKDLMGIIQFLVVIIKSMPASSWLNERCSRQWQNIILYQLWGLLSGIGPSCRDMSCMFSRRAQKTLMHHLQIIRGNSKMTSRQYLNFVVYYFVRPYVTANLCEKGAVFKVAVHKILLLDMRKYGTSSCLKQSVNSFSLRSSAANANKIFSSYLVYLPRNNGLTRKGLFLKQMDDWLNVAMETGYIERLPPVPSVRFIRHLGIQVTAAHIISGHSSNEHKVNRAISLKRCLDDIQKKMSREAVLFPSHSNFPNGCSQFADLQTLFLNASMFLKDHVNWLQYPGACQYIVKSFLKLQMILNNDTTYEGQKNELNHVCAAGEISCPNVSGNVFTMRVKDDPDANISIRSSSITTESNTAVAVKEESSVEMYGQFIGHGGILVQDDTKENLFEMGQHSTQIINDYYTHKRQRDSRKSKRGRPRRGEQERRPRPPTTRYCIADIVFTTGDAEWRESGARVEVRLSPSNECLVIVHHDGRTYRQKVSEGRTLDPNPHQLVWKSDSDWSLEFLLREQWDAFRRMYNDFVQRTVKVVTVKSLPIPSVRIIEDTDSLSPGLGLRPPYAIRHADDEIQSALKNNRILYDLDSEDESWLAETNMTNKADKENLYITDEILERTIDKLEKEAFLLKEDNLPIEDAIYACQGIASDVVVRLIYTYWTMKRDSKGKALLRHFQPPPREQYEQELKIWEAKIERCPAEQRDAFLKLNPRPLMSAFCLQSRGFDGSDKSKKMLRQRSQKKLKPSRSSSEDSQRPVYWFEDPAWHPSSHLDQTKSPAHITGVVQQSSMRSHSSDPVSERVEHARSRAAAARKAAAEKTVKFQKRFLRFDSALQKAWALLMEYKAGTVDESLPLTEGFASNMELLFGWCSSLLAQNDNSSDDEPPLSGPNTGDVGQEFLESFTRKCSIENKANNDEHVDQECDDVFIKQDMQDEASPLLPISTKGYPYAWIGSTLLQKPDHPE